MDSGEDGEAGPVADALSPVVMETGNPEPQTVEGIFGDAGDISSSYVFGSCRALLPKVHSCLVSARNCCDNFLLL